MEKNENSPAATHTYRHWLPDINVIIIIIIIDKYTLTAIEGIKVKDTIFYMFHSHKQVNLCTTANVIIQVDKEVSLITILFCCIVFRKVLSKINSYLNF